MMKVANAFKQSIILYKDRKDHGVLPVFCFSMSEKTKEQGA